MVPDLSVRAITTIQEEYIGENGQDIALSEEFSVTTARAQYVREKLKMKTFFASSFVTEKRNRGATDKEKRFLD